MPPRKRVEPTPAPAEEAPEGICRTCWPHGWPHGAHSAHCGHGEYRRTVPVDLSEPADESVLDDEVEA